MVYSGFLEHLCFFFLNENKREEGKEEGRDGGRERKEWEREKERDRDRQRFYLLIQRAG